MSINGTLESVFNKKALTIYLKYILIVYIVTIEVQLFLWKSNIDPPSSQNPNWS